MCDTFLDIHGHQIEPGYLIKTANDNTYLAMINPDTGHLEFQRLNKPPDAEVLWWFYDELQKPEIIERWEEKWTKIFQRLKKLEAVANAAKALYKSQTAGEHFESARKLKIALMALEESEQNA